MVLAVVFLMAAVTKITDLDGFQYQLLLHVRLPPALASIVVFILPWLELTCGVCLALGYAVREAGVIVAALLFLFLMYALIHHADSDCGCFVFPNPLPFTGWWPPVRDFLLLLCALLLAFRAR